MNVLLAIFCTVLMVLGAAELVRLLAFWWHKPLTETNCSVVVIPEGPEDCEYAVRTAAERLRWLGGEDRRLICVNRNDDPEVERICRYLLLQYPYLRLSKTEDLVYHLYNEDRDDCKAIICDHRGEP